MVHIDPKLTGAWIILVHVFEDKKTMEGLKKLSISHNDKNIKKRATDVHIGTGLSFSMDSRNTSLVIEVNPP